MLTVIDIFSKFVWIIPLKLKTEQEVENAFSRILKEQRHSKMCVDKGREFYNKDVQKLVELYSAENEEKPCANERFNWTIKEQIFKYFSANNTRKFVDVLDLLVYQNNNAIEMTPKEASCKENENKVWRNLSRMGGKTLTPKFSIGGNFRITKKKKTFDKGYTQRRTEKYFKFKKKSIDNSSDL